MTNSFTPPGTHEPWPSPPMVESGPGEIVVSMVYNKIGDILLSLPTLRALAAAYRRPLRLIPGGDAFDFLFRGVPQSGPPIRLLDHPQRRGQLAIEPVLAALGAVDTFISITLFPGPAGGSIAELARRSGARRTIGFGVDVAESLSAT